MTLRCRRCNRPIKAQTLIERGILVTYGPTCARRMFVMPGRKAAVGKAIRSIRIRPADAGDTQGQMLLELGYA